MSALRLFLQSIKKVGASVIKLAPTWEITLIMIPMHPGVQGGVHFALSGVHSR